YVFSQADGSPLRDIKDGWQGALRRAGLRKIRVHDTRHTWATRYMEAGGTVAELMKHGGWSSLRMIERYAHATAAHTYATLDRMSAPSVASHVYGTSDAEDAAERMTKTAISA
ncbi:MAG TPA: tyrosine-type recombinase/integrase, partial [bacterium]